MEQGLLNCCALFLYHLYEQHLMLFLRQELLDWRGKYNKKLYTHEQVRIRLKLANVDITTFGAWPKLEELRHLADAIKHGEGKSSEELLHIAPHLFELAALSNSLPTSGRVYTPLLGEDICVRPTHISECADLLEQFWVELGEALTTTLESTSSPFFGFTVRFWPKAVSSQLEALVHFAACRVVMRDSRSRSRRSNHHSLSDPEHR